MRDAAFWAPFYVLLALSLVLTALGLRELYRLRSQPPYIVREPERCASCGSVLTEDDHPADFRKVPVPVIAGELQVQFKVCSTCIALAVSL